MGIPGLIQLLKDSSTPVHLSKFTGKRVAIDGFSLIYRGCYSTAFELNQGIDTVGYLRFIDKMVELFKKYSLEVYFVFDGFGIGHKSGTEKERSVRKEQNKQKGLELLASGQGSEARKYLKRSLNISEQILGNVIDYIEMLGGVKVMVAPYEADAQIAFLFKEGLVDFAISEDSDLLVYGCDNIFLKITDKGYGVYLSLGELAKDQKKREQTVKDVAAQKFIGFNEENRVHVALLAGNDYKAKVKGLGLKGAIELVVSNKDFPELIEKLKNQSRFELPSNFKEHTEEVFNIFRYQRIYNPKTKSLGTLNPLPPDWKEESHKTIGACFEHFEAFVNGKLSKRDFTPREKTKFTREEIIGKPKNEKRKWKRGPRMRPEATSGEYKVTEEERLAHMIYMMDNYGGKGSKISKFDEEMRQIREDEEMDEINAKLNEKTPGLAAEDLFGFLFEWGREEPPEEECDVMIIEEGNSKEKTKKLAILKSEMGKEPANGITQMSQRKQTAKFEDNLSFLISKTPNGTPVRGPVIKIGSKPATPMLIEGEKEEEVMFLEKKRENGRKETKEKKKRETIDLIKREVNDVFKKENQKNSMNIGEEYLLGRNPSSEIKKPRTPKLLGKHPSSVPLGPKSKQTTPKRSPLKPKINEKTEMKKSPLTIRTLEDFFKPSPKPAPLFFCPPIDLEEEDLYSSSTSSWKSPRFGEESVDSDDNSDILDYPNFKKKLQRDNNGPPSGIIEFQRTNETPKGSNEAETDADISMKFLKKSEDTGIFELREDDDEGNGSRTGVFNYFCLSSSNTNSNK